MPEVHAVTVPGGFAVRGRRRREIELRALTGEDELFLLDQARSLTPAERTTALLERALVRRNDEGDPPPARDLTVGDREALLLELRRTTLGPLMQCVLSCPACAEKVDLDLETGALLVPPYERWAERHDVDVQGRRVSFRLPTGADAEAAAPVALDDPDAGARLILERCLGGRADDAFERAVASRIAELDPQAEIVLAIGCPACSEEFEVLFDVGEYLARELLRRPDDLFREIHVLASRYGWGEDEILRLPRARRLLYLELVVEGAPA